MTAIRHITNKAIKNNQPTKVLCIPYNGMFERDLCKTGHEIYCLPPSYQWYNFKDYIPSNLYLMSGLTIFGHNLTFDVVLCNDKVNHNNIMQEWARAFHIPVIVVDHATFAEQLNPAHITQIEEANSIYTTVTCTEAIHNSWNQHGTLIPYGIDIEANPSIHKDINYMIMGKFTENEIPELTQVTKTLDAHIYGDNKNLSKSVDLYLDFIELFQRTKIFINLSTHTNIPYELLMAMACGCGIVTNSPSVIRDLLTPQSAIFIDNILEIIPASKKLNQDPDFLTQSIKINKQIIKEKFNMSSFISAWDDIFIKAKNEVFML